MSSRPWVRLYRREEGSFAQLSLYARALAAELLKLTDDEGIIQIGTKAPHEAVAFALGANRSDRRLLKGHLDELFGDGYLIHEEGRIRIPGFPKFQAEKPFASVIDEAESDERATNEPLSETVKEANGPSSVTEEDAMDTRADRDETTIDPRTSRDESTNEPRAIHDGSTKSELSTRNHTRALREEKRREEEIREYRTTSGDPVQLEPDPPSAQAPPLVEESEPIGPAIKQLEAKYPNGLAAEARDAVALSRRNGKIADSVWLRTLKKLDAYPAEASVQAMRTFVERYADGEKNEQYLIGIARGNASRARDARRPNPVTGYVGPAPARPHEDFEETSLEELERMLG